MTETPTILLHWDAQGNFLWGATEGVRVVCVDERTPDDRVYDTRGVMNQTWIDGVIAGAPPRAAA